MLSDPLTVSITLDNWIVLVQRTTSYGQAVAVCCFFKDQVAKALVGGTVQLDQYDYFVQETEKIIDLREAQFCAALDLHERPTS